MAYTKRTVSAVVTTYNRPEMLNRALLSVLDQTCGVQEIIVVDDNSTCDISQLLSRFSDERIKHVRHATNKGSAAARNTGISCATADYVAFLDDDDQWFPKKTELQLNAIENCWAAVCGLLKMRTGKVVCYPNTLVKRSDLKRGNVLGGTSILMAQTSVMKDTPFDEQLPHGDDWDMYLRLSAKHVIKNVMDCLVLYDDGTHPSMTNERVNLSLSELDKRSAVIDKHKDFLGPHWFNFRKAQMLLSYISLRPNKLKHISKVIKRCGPIPVFLVFLHRLRISMTRPYRGLGTDLDSYQGMTGCS